MCIYVEVGHKWRLNHNKIQNTNMLRYVEDATVNAGMSKVMVLNEEEELEREVCADG